MRLSTKVAKKGSKDVDCAKHWVKRYTSSGFFSALSKQVIFRHCQGQNTTDIRELWPRLLLLFL